MEGQVPKEGIFYTNKGELRTGRPRLRAIIEDIAKLRAFWNTRSCLKASRVCSNNFSNAPTPKQFF
jgi:hypothetical protein